MHGEIIGRLPDVAWKCTLSENGTLAAAACNDGTVRLWKTNDGLHLCAKHRAGFDCAFGAAFSASGEVLVASFFSSKSGAGALVRYGVTSEGELMEVASWKTPLFWNHGSVSVSHNAEMVALAGSDGLHIFDGYRGTLLFSSTAVTEDFDVALSALGRRVAVADRRKLRIYIQGAPDVWRVRTYEGYIPPLEPCCSISASGKTMVATQGDFTFRVWTVNQRAPVIALVGHNALSRGCAISSDGTVAVTTSVDCTVRVWDLNKSSEKEDSSKEGGAKTTVAPKAADTEVSRLKIKTDNGKVQQNLAVENQSRRKEAYNESIHSTFQLQAEFQNKEVPILEDSENKAAAAGKAKGKMTQGSRLLNALGSMSRSVFTSIPM